MRPAMMRLPKLQRIAMIEYYLQIKHAHIAFALASGGLFALRGLLSLAGARRFARALPLRVASWAIDTALLTAALMLLAALQLNPFTTPWLAVKLVALVAYVGLGHAAMRRTGHRGRQALLLGAALLAFVFIWSVARAHHPFGFLFAWFG